MPTLGRGGAGNILSDNEALEQHLRSLGQTANLSFTPSSNVQGYAHMGRGGAGNYSPVTLVPTGEHTNTSPTQDPKDVSPDSPATDHAIAASHTRSQPSVAPAYHGRGGAGNFQNRSNEDAAEKAHHERLRRQQMEENVKKDVEADVVARIPKPDRAHLSAAAGEEWM